MIEVIQANSWEWMWNFEGQVDHIITDFPYGTTFHLPACKKICPGNIITFCTYYDHPFPLRPKVDEKAYWVKTPSTKNFSKFLGKFVEEIYIHRNGTTFNKLHWSQMKGIYDDLVIEAEGHQWRKPLSLMERLVRIYTNPGDTILDPFCGEGTTLQACENLGRNAIGIDIDTKWVNHCIENLGGIFWNRK